jgi:hypothetical protein
VLRGSGEKNGRKQHATQTQQPGQNTATSRLGSACRVNQAVYLTVHPSPIHTQAAAQGGDAGPCDLHL